MSLPPINHLNYLDYHSNIDLTEENFSSSKSLDDEDSFNEESLSDFFQSIKSEFSTFPDLSPQTEILYHHSLEDFDLLTQDLPLESSSFPSSSLPPQVSSIISNQSKLDEISTIKRKRIETDQSETHEKVEEIKESEIEKPKKKKHKKTLDKEISKTSLTFEHFVENYSNRLNIEGPSLPFNEHFHRSLSHFYQSIEKQNEEENLFFTKNINMLFSLIIKQESIKKNFVLSLGTKRVEFYQNNIATFLHEEMRKSFLEALKWRCQYNIDLASDFEAMEKNFNSATLTHFVTNLYFLNLRRAQADKQETYIKKATELFDNFKKNDNDFVFEIEIKKIKDVFIQSLSQVSRTVRDFTVKKFPLLQTYNLRIVFHSNPSPIEIQKKEQPIQFNPDAFFEMNSGNNSANTLEIPKKNTNFFRLKYIFKKIPKKNNRSDYNFEKLLETFKPQVSENTFRKYIWIIRHEYYIIQNDSSYEKEDKANKFIENINILFSKCLSIEEDKNRFKEQLNFIGKTLCDFIKNGIGPILNTNLKSELNKFFPENVSINKNSLINDLYNLKDFTFENLMLFSKNYLMLYQQNHRISKDLESLILQYFMDLNLEDSKTIATLSKFLEQIHPEINAKLIQNLPLQKFAKSNIPEHIIKNLQNFNQLPSIITSTYEITNESLMISLGILKHDFSLNHLVTFAQGFHDLPIKKNSDYKELCGKILSFFNDLDFNDQNVCNVFKEFLANVDPGIKSKLLPYLPIQKYVACNLAQRIQA